MSNELWSIALKYLQFFRAGTTHRTLPAMVNRSNSLGRSLPPIPSKPPPLVRRRTFEDEDERRMDWI